MENMECESKYLPTHHLYPAGFGLMHVFSHWALDSQPHPRHDTHWLFWHLYPKMEPAPVVVVPAAPVVVVGGTKVTIVGVVTLGVVALGVVGAVVVVAMMKGSAVVLGALVVLGPLVVGVSTPGMKLAGAVSRPSFFCSPWPPPPRFIMFMADELWRRAAAATARASWSFMMLLMRLFLLCKRDWFCFSNLK